MGIRFHCPKGHKLNVKKFQAGKRGFCPHCGERFQIPTESTRLSSREERRARQRGDAGVPIPSPHFETEESHLLHSEPVKSISPPPLSPSPEVEPGHPPHGTDPLGDSAEVVWYVRPPTGGQFGPATPDILRSWLAEGRISAETMVWREGWPDWQEAHRIFPHLIPASTEAHLTTNPPHIYVPMGLPPHLAHLHQRYPKRYSAKIYWLLAASGLVTIAVLGFTIWYFARNQ